MSPKVSVLMAAYNAAPFIRAAIDSILGQTFTDFELIVVDDGSTDRTGDIVASYTDTRIRLLRCPRNMGMVVARNLGFARAAGLYLAVHDADDISHPTRLARQVAHLDTHPGDVLVSCDIRQLHPDGELTRSRYHGEASPLLLDWMLLLGNPIAFSSTMMRCPVLRRLPEFLREDRRYAEDFDLYMRLRAQGGIARLAMPLVIYRVHPGSASSRNKARMVEQTGRVLADMWRADMFMDDEGALVAMLAARHLACAEPAESMAVLERLRDALNRLAAHFLMRHPECCQSERDAVAFYASRVWEHAVRVSLRTGTITWPTRPFCRTSGVVSGGRGAGLLSSALRGRMKQRLRRRQHENGDAALRAAGVQEAVAERRVPSLYATVVLEGAEDGDQARQSAGFALLAQEVFDTYGLRPLYLLDKRVVLQPPVCAALRNVQDAGLCAIGAWCGTPAEPATTLDVPPPTGGIIWRGAAMLDRLGVSAIGPARGKRAGLLRRLELSRHVTLQQNDNDSRQQIILIRSLLAKGERRFFLRIHLRQGSQGTALALDRLRQVCTYFFEHVGGLPGDGRMFGGSQPDAALGHDSTHQALFVA